VSGAYFNPATSLCLSKASTGIHNSICQGLFSMFNCLMEDVIVSFVDNEIFVIVDHHC
jgi:hypothetical protein